MNLKQQVAELDDKIALQRQLIKGLTTDVSNPNFVQRCIEDKRAAIEKLQKEVAILERRVIEGPGLLADAYEELEKNLQLRANLVNSKRDTKIAAISKQLAKAGLTPEEAMQLIAAASE